MNPTSTAATSTSVHSETVNEVESPTHTIGSLNDIASLAGGNRRRRRAFVAKLRKMLREQAKKSSRAA